MPTLSQAYIAQHRNTTHTYAAFGKLLIDTLLDKTSALLGSTEMDTVNLELAFEVSPFEGSDCIRICLRTENDEVWCTNQFEDAVYERESD